MLRTYLSLVLRHDGGFLFFLRGLLYHRCEVWEIDDLG